MWQIKYNTRRIRRSIENGSQQMPTSAADVGNRLEARKIAGAKHSGDDGLRFARHGFVENTAFVRMLRHVVPHSTGHSLTQRRFSPAYGIFQQLERFPATHDRTSDH